jgi:hypothetical protein
MTAPAPETPADLVRTELARGLPELEPIDFEAECALSDGPLDAVAWTYTAMPRPGHPFLGVHLTVPFALRGVTLVRRAEDGSALLRWYIDWLDALNRAGLNAALRPVPDGPQPSLPDLLPMVP